MPSPTKHPTTGVYYLRQRVPADISPKVRGGRVRLLVAGKPRSVRLGAEVKVTLDTKDAKEAKERFREVDADLQRLWQGYRDGPRTLPFKDIVAFAGLAYRTFTEAFDAEPGSPELWRDVLDMNRRAAEGDLTGLKIKPKSKPAGVDAEGAERRVGDIVDALIAREGLLVDARTRWRMMVETLKALSAAAETNLAKAEGDYSPDTKATRFPAWEPSPASTKAAPAQAPSVTVTDLFDRWKARVELTGGSPASVRRWSPVIKGFVAFLGHDDATRVTKADVIRWRDDLLDKGVIRLDTFGKVYRAALSAVFAVGVDDLLLTDNPVAGLRVAREKRTTLRDKGFTDDEAARILKAALDAPSTPGKTGAKLRMARRWVPWICAYTGARVSEVTQLRKEDLVTVNGIACIRITPEAGTVKTKGFRLAPLHRRLLEQGFVEFVNGCDDPTLFYNASTDADGHPWEHVSGRIGAWVRDVVGIKDEAIRPNHAWRHRFKTLAREAGIPVEVVDAICGHATRTAGEAYGSMPVTVMKREIEKLQ